MDTSIFVKSNRGYNLVFKDPSVLIRFTDSKDSIANHLRSQLARGSDFRIAEIMQSDSIPAPMLNSKRDDLITGGKKGISQIHKLIRLIFCQSKFYADGSFHTAEKYAKPLFYLQTKIEEQRFLPALKDWVSALSIG
jgi:hypothetical protein